MSAESTVGNAKRGADTVGDVTSTPKRVCLGDDKPTEASQSELTPVSVQNVENGPAADDECEEANEVDLTSANEAIQTTQSNDTPAHSSASQAAEDDSENIQNDEPSECAEQSLEDDRASPLLDTLPASVHERISIVKETISGAVEDALSVFETQIESFIRSRDATNHALRTMEYVMDTKNQTIESLESQNANLRKELERCKERLYQHGKETEEWVDRMKEMLRRMPGCGNL